MKLRLKLNGEPASTLKEGSLLSEFVKKNLVTDTRKLDLDSLREAAGIVAQGTASLAKINQDFARDSLSDAVAVAQSFGRIRSSHDLLEHQVGVGVMVVTGTITQFERVRDTLDTTTQNLKQLAEDRDNSQTG